MRPAQIAVPSLVRIKPGALARLGVYLRRAGTARAVVVASAGLPMFILDEAKGALARADISLVACHEAGDATYEAASTLAGAMLLSGAADVIVGLGGGKALDVAKLMASIAGLPMVAVPTSLSNDGFASPRASLTVSGARRSLACAGPVGVVVDTEVCLGAPEALWLSGIGDVVAKVTAVRDWKLAFHATGTPVDDLAALLSDATVFQLMAHTVRDLEGQRLLATALLQNGVAMTMAGSSRPASGSEHLISHALDETGVDVRLHGLQVGVAAALMALLQENDAAERVIAMLETSGFLAHLKGQPLSRHAWHDAVRRAPSVKRDFYTVLSAHDDAPAKVLALIDRTPALRAVFV